MEIDEPCPRFFDSFLTEFFHSDTIGGTQEFFKPWDFEKIWNGNEIWRFVAKYRYLYVISNDCVEKTLWTHVGIVNTLEHRFYQHNAKMPGGPTETRKDKGDWHYVIIVRFPPIRNYSLCDVRNYCLKKKGTLNRYETVLKFAQEKGLEYFISKDLLDEKSVFYFKKIHDYILKLQSDKRFSMERNILPKQFDRIHKFIKDEKAKKRKIDEIDA
jgi:hypothetical protein